MAKYRWFNYRPDEKYARWRDPVQLQRLMIREEELRVRREESAREQILEEERLRVSTGYITADGGIQDLDDRVQNLEDQANFTIQHPQNFYEGGWSQPVYSGMDRDEMLTGMIQSAMNASTVGVDINDPNNVFVTIIRNIVTGMRDNGEI